MLKNRATDKVLFVVLFTLYLKEDVDDKGEPKEGVETGKPFHLMGEKDRERYEGRREGDDKGEAKEEMKEDDKSVEGNKREKFYDDGEGVD